MLRGRPGGSELVRDAHQPDGVDRVVHVHDHREEGVVHRLVPHQPLQPHGAAEHKGHHKEPSRHRRRHVEVVGGQEDGGHLVRLDTQDVTHVPSRDDDVRARHDGQRVVHAVRPVPHVPQVAQHVLAGDQRAGASPRTRAVRLQHVRRVHEGHAGREDRVHERDHVVVARDEVEPGKHQQRERTDGHFCFTTDTLLFATTKPNSKIFGFRPNGYRRERRRFDRFPPFDRRFGRDPLYVVVFVLVLAFQSAIVFLTCCSLASSVPPLFT